MTAPIIKEKSGTIVYYQAKTTACEITPDGNFEPQVVTAEECKEVRMMKAESDKMVSAVKAKEVDIQIYNDLIKDNPFFLGKEKVQEAAKLLGIQPVGMLPQLVLLTKSNARPQISGYEVSVVALGKSGNIYLGVNLEFLKVPLTQAIHGEQFMVVNARNHGETALEAIALSADPCGFCRQFLNEIAPKEQIKILTPNGDTNFDLLLPNPFGPKELGKEGGLLTPYEEPKKSKHPDALMARAFEVARTSYVRYTESMAGVAIKTKDGQFYTGCCLENVAYNPTISPMQAALVALVSAKRSYEEIEAVVLAEFRDAKVSQKATTEMILQSIAPKASFRAVYLTA